MLNNYLKIAWRNIKRNKIYALINILGLATGLGCVLAVYTMINFEYSFDEFHEDTDRIHRLVLDDREFGKNSITPYAAGYYFKADFPELLTTQTHGIETYKISVPQADDRIEPFRQSQVLFADENFFKVFDFEWASSEVAPVLKDPGDILITESIAKKYFGNAEPLDKTLYLNDTVALTVKGVLKDTPANTTLPFAVIIPYEIFYKIHPNKETDWHDHWGHQLFIKVPEGKNIEEYENRLKIWEQTHMEPKMAESVDYSFQPLAEWHTDDSYGHGTHYTVPSEIVLALSILAIIVMLTAIVNFINLSTAQAGRRAREVGLRKVVGSTRSQLVAQFLLETLAIVLIATLAGLMLAELFVGQLNNILSSISYNLQIQKETIWFSFLAALIVSMVSGFYPAYILSGFKPVQALKNQLSVNAAGSFPIRRILIVLQFSFSNLLIIGTIILTAQMNYVRSADLGFEDDKVFIIEAFNANEDDRQALRYELEAMPDVKSVSFNFAAPLTTYVTTGTLKRDEWNDPDRYVWGNFKAIDEYYLDIFQIDLVAGKNVRPVFHGEADLQLIINETGVRELGFERPQDAIGHEVNTYSYAGEKGRIVGVVKDFFHQPFTEEMTACILYYNPNNLERMSVQVASDNISQTFAGVKTIFKKHQPNEVFSYELLKDDYLQLYIVEDLMHKLFTSVSVLAIIIGLVGLYGLVSFMINRKRKEMSIRKVMGATVNQVLGIFMREYALLILISFVVAAPLIYLGMDMWLQSFVYRIDLSLSYFLVGLLVSCILAAITVGYKSVKAASANPTDYLKDN